MSLQYVSRKKVVTVLGHDRLIGVYEGEQYWHVMTDGQDWAIRESLLLNGLTTCPQPPLGQKEARERLEGFEGGQCPCGCKEED